MAILTYNNPHELYTTFLCFYIVEYTTFLCFYIVEGRG